MKTFKKHKQLNRPSNNHGKKRVNQYQGLLQSGSYGSPSGCKEMGSLKGGGTGAQAWQCLNGSVALGTGRM